MSRQPDDGHPAAPQRDRGRAGRHPRRGGHTGRAQRDGDQRRHAGFVTVYPAGAAQPDTSNVNVPTALTQANEVLSGLGAERDVALTVGGGGAPEAQLVIDVVGYLTS